MSKRRAVIVGCGRIGVGYGDWPKTPYIYDHASTYLALKDRVELVGFVDLDPAKRQAAADKYGKDLYYSNFLSGTLEKLKPDIVSICTPPYERENLLNLCREHGVKGVWCEKPLGCGGSTWGLGGLKVQINYIRRFDPLHRWIAESGEGRGAKLWVAAKKDIHTVCHFTDLARFWGSTLEYEERQEPCEYTLTSRRWFAFGREGGIVGGFMEVALKNLLDAVEGKAELLSPPESAIESEKWAQEILDGKSA